MLWISSTRLFYKFINNLILIKELMLQQYESLFTKT
jgi:hypothetical protein